VEEQPSRETYSIIWYSCSPALRIDMFLPITFSGVAVLCCLVALSREERSPLATFEAEHRTAHARSAIATVLGRCPR